MTKNRRPRRGQEIRGEIIQGQETEAHCLPKKHPMKSHYKKKALIGIPLGLVLMVGSIVFAFKHLVPVPFGVPLVMGGFFGGMGLYIWGCLALAKAKGYSTALILTIVLGILFPAVVLLALPDKHKDYKRRRR